MPPHCDSMDGPVVAAARRALDHEDVDVILPYVPASGEDEVRDAFERVVKARSQGPEAKGIADLYFFETTVRIHRAGEGAPFTGLKPAGLDVGPVIPLAEDAIATGNPEHLIEFFVEGVRSEIEDRFDRVVTTGIHSDEGVAEAREHVEAVLGLQVWSHKLHGAIKAAAHEGHHAHG